ncbi:MAG: hypothetical protein WC889_16225 [Myxococcota bacterium]|jgi:hypothetical protein
MVQVDIVWSYAFGATFAAAAARQVKETAKEEGTLFHSRQFTYLLLFLSILFAPSGLYLLWEFPHWETMQVARTWADLPAWLVCLFAITNITQGILGYWTSALLIRSGRLYGAHVNWMVAWTIFWSILVMGWDTTGWQRFLYDPTVNGGVFWSPGTHMGLSFFKSNVFLTLVGMAVPIGPALVIPIAKWIREGAASDPSIPGDRVPGMVKIMIVVLVGTFVIPLVLAILCGLLVFLIRDLTGSIPLAYAAGLPAFWFMVYFMLLKPGRPLYLYARMLFIEEFRRG